jgi:DNA invertase Pin-like site-specific DNA recombinase
MNPTGRVSAIGYVRRSKKPRKGAGERTVSLEDQRARIEAYCREQGWRLAAVLSDDGVSGGRRERLDRLDAQIRETGARFVVVYHLDRFARDVAALLDRLRAYTRRGVELHVVGRGRIDVGTATGFLMAGVEGLMAEHYRRLIGEKTRDALARLRAKARRVSRFAPYGYALTSGGRLVVQAKEQAVLGQIVALRGGGLSLRGVSKALAARGILARNGRPFTAEVLRAVSNRAHADRQAASL